MSAAYRDENESLRARTHELEARIAERDREIDDLRKKLADQDAVFARLETALEDKRPKPPPPVWRSPRLGLAVVSALIVGSGAFVVAARAPRIPVAQAAPVVVAPNANVKPSDPCATPGVRLTVDGEDAVAPAANERDLAGHKYRRGGDRSPWFTVNGGNIYVHGVGDFLRRDTGETRLLLLTIKTKGEDGMYELARGGRSVVEVLASDGKRISGRFEADMSKVSDTTREPPFGTPVVRVRGTFCLPAYPANPNDTGP